MHVERRPRPARLNQLSAEQDGTPEELAVASREGCRRCLSLSPSAPEVRKDDERDSLELDAPLPVVSELCERRPGHAVQIRSAVSGRLTTQRWCCFVEILALCAREGWRISYTSAAPRELRLIAAAHEMRSERAGAVCVCLGGETSPSHLLTQDESSDSPQRDRAGERGLDCTFTAFSPLVQVQKGPGEGCGRAHRSEAELHPPPNVLVAPIHSVCGRAHICTAESAVWITATLARVSLVCASGRWKDTGQERWTTV